MDWIECCPQGKVWYAEQKARFIDTKTAQYYQTLYIGKNKIDFFEANKDSINGRIYFDLTDGLFFIDYDYNIFKDFRTKPHQRTDRDVYDSESEVVLIPFNLLTPVVVP